MFLRITKQDGFFFIDLAEFKFQFVQPPRQIQSSVFLAITFAKNQEMGRSHNVILTFLSLSACSTLVKLGIGLASDDVTKLSNAWQRGKLVLNKGSVPYKSMLGEKSLTW